jgi:hypothetical protein
MVNAAAVYITAAATLNEHDLETVAATRGSMPGVTETDLS